MDYTYRTATAADWDEISHLVADAFNEEFDEASMAAEGINIEPERSVVAVRDGAIAGHVSAYTRDLAVPGATVAASHVTMVSVDAAHRRQGLLTTMITEIHEHATSRDEPIAVLWATEGKIYQRYGYGLAAQKLAFEGQSRDIVWRDQSEPDPGRLRTVSAASADEFRDVFESVWADRPGYSSRGGKWWEHVLADPPAGRNGATSLRAVVHADESGQTDGYLLWRVKGDWDEAGPDGKVLVRELIATNPIAYRALWEFALSIDLTRRFSIRFAAIDEPVQFLVTEPRRLQAKLGDALWVRILDVPSALESRRYATPVDVVLDVTDDRMPSNNGRWHLVGSPDKATCTRTDAPADIAVPIRALGAAYLGGTALARPAAGGQIRELRPGTLAPTSIAFSWHRLPTPADVF